MKHNLYERSCSQYSVIIYASRRFYFTAGAHILCQSISVPKSILPKSAFNRNKLLLFRHFFLRFLREGNNQNTVVIFRMNVLMLQLFSYIETSGAPVSYTHLDVYKRQARTLPFSSTATAFVLDVPTSHPMYIFMTSLLLS